jgi:hypothetical protein
MDGIKQSRRRISIRVEATSKPSKLALHINQKFYDYPRNSFLHVTARSAGNCSKLKKRYLTGVELEILEFAEQILHDVVDVLLEVFNLTGPAHNKLI